MAYPYGMATFEPGDEPNRCCARTKASTKENPKRCKQPVTAGRHVCRLHGGNAGRPCITGAHSKYLQTGKLAQAYEAALANPRMYEMDEHLAVMEAASRRAAERVQALDTPGFRKELRALLDDCVAARNEDNEAEFIVAFDELGKLIKRGAWEDQAINAWVTAVERRAKRLEAALHIRLSGAQAVNAREMMTILVAITKIIEKQTTPQVAAQIARLINAQVIGTGKLQA